MGLRLSRLVSACRCSSSKSWMKVSVSQDMSEEALPRRMGGLGAGAGAGIMRLAKSPRLVQKLRCFGSCVRLWLILRMMIWKRIFRATYQMAAEIFA